MPKFSSFKNILPHVSVMTGLSEMGTSTFGENAELSFVLR